MNRLRLSAELAHLPEGSIEYCHQKRGCASSAYEISEKKAKILLRIPRALGASNIVLKLYTDDISKLILSADGTWMNSEVGTDTYKFDINLSSLSRGLYFFNFEIKTSIYTLYSSRHFNEISFSPRKENINMCQLSVVDFKYSQPDAVYGGIIYHIFVDRFNRGGTVHIKDSANLINGEWHIIPEYPEYPGAPLKNNSFYGGTLWGIIDKLDYIASLGANIIYLSPVFDSVSNHKYDTADYMRVDEMFGGDAALKHLINECNNRDIKVILDGVFNHTGADSIYFNKYSRYNSIGAYQSVDSKYYSWYDFKCHPNKYTCWWDIDILPRINPDVPSCRDFFTGDGGVIEKYRKMGIYGLRLDVADELSDEFISDIKQKVSYGGESMLYGEVWEDASNKIAYETRKKYYLGDELDGVMNYPLRTGIIDYIKNHNTDSLRYALFDIFTNAPSRVANAQMNLLGTHDTERILTVLGGRDADGYTNAELSVIRMSDEEKKVAISKLKMAYTILSTVPGVPAIFYGDEAGLEGYRDPFNRMPYPWNREIKELIEHFTRIGEIRRNNEVYKLGDFKLCFIDRDMLIFERKDDKNILVTVCNNSDNSVTLRFKSKAQGLLSIKNTNTYTLDPMTAEIFKLNKSDEITVF